MRNRYCRRLAAFTPLLLCALTGGCANQPPTSNALSGKRLIVTMNFRQALNPRYSYFFMINNAGDLNAPGPVAVYTPDSTGSGNGIATGSGGGQNGFTDFVRYDEIQPQSIPNLYHVVSGTNASNRLNAVLEGRPIDVTPIVTNPDDTNSTRLQFQIDLSQLITGPNGEAVDAATAKARAAAIRYLQLNIIATSTTDLNPAAKATDAMGNTLTTTGQSSYLLIDLGASQTQYRTYSSTDSFALDTSEPTANDVFPYGNAAYDPALDLTSWTIEFRTFQ